MYIQAGNSPWSYCGCVANAKPSDVFALRWPVDDNGAPFATAAIGISVEPLAATLEKESVLIQHKETFAKRVAEDLLRFMQSFQTGGDAQHMVVPTNILDRWFDKFINKFRRDPGFIDRPRLDAA
jgi:ribulose-phosphate 3-epimerase